MKPIKSILAVLLMAMFAFSCSELEELNNWGNGTNDSITLEFTEKEVSASEQTISVGVASSGDWIVTAETPVSWCSVTKETSTTAVIAISENKEYDSRSAVFVFKCGNATAKLTIKQDEERDFTLSETNFKIGSDGGNIKIPIQANVDYTCKVNDTCKDWITISQTKSLMDCQIILTVSKNETPNEREGNIYITMIR